MAEDIVRTVATEPTLTSVGILAIIVLIRTFLSISLEVDLTGRWPWQNKHRPAPAGVSRLPRRQGAALTPAGRVRGRQLTASDRMMTRAPSP